MVADTNTTIPDGPLFPGGPTTFGSFDHVSLADGSTAFMAFGGGGSGPRGIYTDIGGTLNAVVDTNANKFITVAGAPVELTGLSMGPEALGSTPTGRRYRGTAAGTTTHHRGTLGVGDTPGGDRRIGVGNPSGDNRDRTKEEVQH